MAARGIQGMIVAAALLGLAACGSVSASSVTASSAARPAASGTAAAVSGTAAAAGSLCADRPSADRVVVSRTASPRQVTLTASAQVQAMAAALCALPALPAGQHCDAAAAGSIRLIFAAGNQSFPPVTVQESGCRSVTGLGTTRSWSGFAQVSVMLDEAVGGLGRLVPGTHPSSVPFGS